MLLFLEGEAPAEPDVSNIRGSAGASPFKSPASLRVGKKLTLPLRMLSFLHMSQFNAGFGFWFSGYFYPPGHTAF